jgi:hypothetical protein
MPAARLTMRAGRERPRHGHIDPSRSDASVPRGRRSVLREAQAATTTAVAGPDARVGGTTTTTVTIRSARAPPLLRDLAVPPTVVAHRP